jgi:tetratricopeptide (TPR) repeat protein
MQAFRLQTNAVLNMPQWRCRVPTMSRLAACTLALVAGFAWSAPALAQALDPEQLKPVEPPSTLPRAQRGDRTQNLDRLFEALKVAPDDESAKYVESRIWAIWLASASDTANLLMGRVRTAIEAEDFELAIKLLNAIIDIKPDFIEAWNRRATVYYAKKEFGRALADIREVLAHEPRHFGALSGLGIILQELGDEKGALDVLRRALAIHPHLEHIPDLVKKLSDKVNGRDI